MGVNLVAVLIASIVAMAVGHIWYAPGVFGKEWMKLAKIKPPKKKQKHMASTIILAWLSNIVMAYVLAIFLSFTKASTLATSLVVGVLVWVGFIATVSLGSILWEGKPVKLYVLNIAYNLVSITLMVLELYFL